MSDTPLTDEAISWRIAYASTGVGTEKISMRVDYVEPDDCRRIERELRDEIASLRKDAERYRWVREWRARSARWNCYEVDYKVSILFRKKPPSLNGYTVDAPLNEELDAAIDAAMLPPNAGEGEI